MLLFLFFCLNRKPTGASNPGGALLIWSSIVSKPVRIIADIMRKICLFPDRCEPR